MSAPEKFSDSKRKLLERILRGEAARQSWEAPLDPREPGAPIPLAPAQQQIWLHSQMAPGTALYNEPVALHYRGAMDRAVLERSFHELLRRHEIWRTTFAAVDGQVVQVVHPELAIPIPLTDLSALPPQQRDQEAARIDAADAGRPFDLGVGPLLRLRLFKFAEDRYRLSITVHHIIFDGVSIFGVVLTELPAIYEAFSQGLPSPLPEPRYQYADYALWEKRLLDNDSASRQMEYWRATLGSELPVLELPADKPRPALPSYRGSLETFTLDARMTAALKDAANAQGVTFYMLLLAAFKVLLFRYSGQEDILIGGAADGRKRPEFQHLLGFFLHTVVLRSRPKPELPFREYVAQVKDTVLGALAASDIPFDQVVRELHPRRDLSRHPLFQVMFSVEPPAAKVDPRWNMTHMDLFSGFSKFDLYVGLDEGPEGALIGRFIYNTDIFEAATVRRMIDNWRTLLEGILRDPGMTLSELPLLPDKERRLVAETWNQTARPLPHTTIHQLFEHQAARTPQAVAVEDEARSLTYRQLNREANRLAHRLQELGAAPEVLIGLSVERSCDMLVALLAILKSGAAYLPLDPALPEERLNLLLEDAQIGLVLTDRELAPRLARPGLRLVFCDEGYGSAGNPDSPAGPQNRAYVLYTSGSTGRPKGVEVPHSAVVNFLLSMRREPGYTAADTMLALTTLSFDIAALEIFLPLIAGGRVVVASHPDTRDPARLLKLLAEVSPSVAQATPALWRALIEAGWKGDKKLKVLCGGEAMPRDLAQQLLARCGELWNMYGPTETTVWSTIQRVTAGNGAVTIGRPIDNTRVYVLDARRHLVPQGVVGELYIGGAGVARGYLHRPELTGERFVVEPSVDPGRIYRTGDLARWRPDGMLECLGRADNQIKIRGFRIEPEEIEAAILDHPEVTGAAVKAWTDASQHQSLTAYVTGPAMPAEVRTYLEAKLPQYMVPTRWVSLESLPLTPNGKVDRKRLPPPDLQAEHGEYVAPSSDIERRLVNVWESVLGRKGIGARDNFFDLGGHSLLVAKLLRRLEFEFGIRFTMATVFQAPTIEQFAQVLKAQGTEAHTPFAIPLQPRGSRTPLLWLYAGPMFRALASHLGEDQPFLGIAPDSSETASLSENFRLEELAACLVRKIRAVQPDGPYNLGGWCAEGILAFEVASQLRRHGGQVNVVILLDSINPSRYRRMRPGSIAASRVLFNLKRIASLRPHNLFQFMKERAASLVYHSAQYARPAGSFESRLDQAALAYEPEQYGGRVVAIMPDAYPSYRDPVMHWSDRVTGEFQLRRVSGNHVTMLEEPWVPDLANCISACLAEAEASAGSQRRKGAPPAKLAAG